MENKWKTAFGCIRGSLHILDGKPCEDWTRKYETNGRLMVTMCDGASRARASFHGARIVCQQTQSWLNHHAEKLFRLDTEEAISLLKCELLNFVLECIDKNILSQQYGSREDYATTLMFFIGNGERYYAGNLGDGMIGCLTPGQGAEVLLEPENDLWKNRTWHVTSAQANQHFRIISGEMTKGQTYFMMTDGSVDCLYQRRKKSFAEALPLLCSWLERDHDERTISIAMQRRMEQLFPKCTTDDCALSIFRYRASSPITPIADEPHLSPTDLEPGETQS